MSAWSSFAWVLHDLGLATAVGGAIYGKFAFHPAARRIGDPQERDEVVDTAWKRFQALNLIAHGTVATTWFIGRHLLSGREAGPKARALTIAKDSLIGTSLVTGLASTVLGRVLSAKIERHEGPAEEAHENGSRRLERAVGVLGSANLATNAGVVAVTSLLAMQAGRSGRFAVVSHLSRFVP